MVWSAALSGAVARVMRGTAGRRALQLALLVGAVFALGLVCGERAQAAESVPGVSGAVVSGSVAKATEAVAEPGSTETAEPGSTETAAPGATSVERDGESVGESVGESAGEHVGKATQRLTDGLTSGPSGLANGLTGGLRDGHERVEGGLGDVRDKVTSPPAALPTLPRLPLPDLPSAPQPPSVPVAGVPEPAPADETSADRHEADASDASDGEAAERAAHGPVLPVAPAQNTWHTARDHRSAPTAHAGAPTPLQQPPGGEPDGVLGNRAATDGSGPRYGDAHALTPEDRAPLGLVPGAAARVDAAETRDRYRDIPVSPA